MKYKFFNYTRNDPWRPDDNYTRPVVEIENASAYGDFFDAEINNLYSNPEYVEAIVDKLASLLKGDIDFYDGFGYEVYMIECDREVARVRNVFEGDSIEAEIPVQEVYELMRDWRDYLREWGKNNP